MPFMFVFMFNIIAHAETVGDFLDALKGSDPTTKNQYIYYFAGVQDALMYANSWMGLTRRDQPVCFPSPIPDRRRLFDEFLEHIDTASEAMGADRVLLTEMDQLMLAGWIHKYPCPK